MVSQAEITQKELLMDNVNYQIFNTKSGKLGWLSYLAKCAYFIRQQKADIVVLLHSAAAPITLFIGKIPTCLYWNEHPTNLIHLPNSFAPLRHTLVLMLHRLIFSGAKKSKLVMPIGEEHQDDLYQHQVGFNKVRMLPMGVSDKFLLVTSVIQFKPYEPLQLIYIGTVSKARGRDVMLEAMSLLVKNKVNVHLTIVGASLDQIDICTQRIKDLDIIKNISLIGKVSGEQIPSYLAQADIGICLWEQNPWNEFNPPTKLFEYLVAGIPVLASNIRTHTRYVHHWKNGLIFDYDATSLANAITELHKHTNKIQSLKKQAAESGQPYLWSRIEPIFLDYVNKAANGIAYS